MTLQAGATLGRFRIAGHLGAGGMGVVYRAHDPVLHRDVALKVLTPAGLDAPAARSALVREARAVAALNHPNICTIYEVVDTGEHVCLAMECVEGERLDLLLQRERLAVDRLIGLATQLAAAVAEAHRAGIVHRDIKTGNAIVTGDGRVKVLDFGLSIRSGRMPDDETLSHQPDDAAAVSGTVPYMAPEVLRGEPATARSDVWSLGIVLYEMTMGRRPFQSRNGAELSSAILRDPPPPLAADVPPTLATLIRRSLAKHPAERYGDAGEVHAVLETIGPAAAAPIQPPRRSNGFRAAVAAAAASAVVVAGGWLLWSRHAPASRVESLAVLPFENLSREAAQDFFSDGMTEELTTTLAQTARLTVISRTSSARFKGSRDPLPHIARALGADVILEGSVLRAGSRVRVNVKLIDGTTDRNLWADSFERDGGDVLAMQSEIARAVASQVNARFNPQSPAVPGRLDPRAYEAYLLGRAYARQRSAGVMDKAVESLRHATELEPSWAAAHAALADAYLARDIWAGFGIGNSAALVKAEADRAVALDPTLAEAHLALARVYDRHEWNWTAGDAAYLRAIDLNPSLAEAHAGYGQLLQTLGRHDAAVASVRRAVRLEPLSSSVQSDCGRVLYRARRYQEAADAYREALRLDPESGSVLGRLMPVEVLQDHLDQARGILARLERQASGLAPHVLDLAAALLAWRTGQLAEVRRIAGRIEENLPSHSRVGERAMILATLYSLIDERDRALGWLTRGVDERSLLPLQFRDPLFDGVRGDARFKALLRRLDLPD